MENLFVLTLLIIFGIKLFRYLMQNIYPREYGKTFKIVLFKKKSYFLQQEIEMFAIFKTN